MVRRNTWLALVCVLSLFAACSDTLVVDDKPQSFPACEGREFVIEEPVAGRAWTPNAISLKSERFANGVFVVYDQNAPEHGPTGIPLATTGGFIVGDRGVLLVESMINRRLFCQVVDLIRAETDKPVRYVVNTSHHGDHSYGNHFLPDGVEVVQHENTAAFINDSEKFAGDVAFMEVSPSYVSKLVSRLEERLGVALLHRTTRSLTLTGPGRALYETCSSSLLSITHALDEAAASQQRLSGTLRITLGTGLGAHWLTHPLVEFMSRHPGLTVDLVYLDRFVDLVDEGFDIGIRVGQLRDSTMIARRLATVTRMLVASPAYLEARGTPARVRDLTEHKCLLYAYHQTPETWTLHHGDETARVTVSGAVVANSGAALSSMVAAGMGIALLPEFHVSELLRDRQLVRVLPEWSNDLPVHAIFPNSRHVPAKVRALIDFVGERLSVA